MKRSNKKAFIMGLKRDSPLAKNILLCIVLALVCASRAVAQLDVDIPEVARPEVIVDAVELLPEEAPAEAPVAAPSNDTGAAPAEDPLEDTADPVEVLTRQKNLEVRSGAYMQFEDEVVGDESILPTGELERQLVLPGAGNVNTQFDHIDGRVIPDMNIRPSGQPYVITNQRLDQIRGNFLYWFYDRGGNENIGDYQRDIHSSSPQIHKNFNFQLPFFGFRFNYTRVSVNGFLEFSDPPDHYRYPLRFPIRDWPQVNDPSFIGIFFSKCRIGAIRPEEVDQRRPGVYFRMDRDLEGRTDQFGVEMRERVTWDVRQGVIGADNFNPKHAVTVTWKNVSFLGGIDNSLYTTNSFQMVLATDEVITYAIFNYVEITWSSHTQAGGDTTGGEGGVPAYIGFNAGNGTRSYEYLPYSQALVLRDLTHRGWGNGFPGRHIFRIDENILLGSCNKDIDGANLPLMFAPESGNMLGGTIVNITGPCFSPNDRISCRFDAVAVIGAVVNENRAICVQPRFYAQGYQRFEVAINNEPYKWKGVYFVETPATAAEKIFFTDDAVHQANPSEIRITWDQYNLTTNLNIGLKISLYGYRETTIRPEFELIDILEDGVSNTGFFTISPENYRTRDNFLTNSMEFGYIQITLTAPVIYNNIEITPILWSRPIPLAWYFNPQWEIIHGQNWPNRMCNNWLTNDRFLRNFASDVWLCPCTLDHAFLDKGRFLPDFACDRDINPRCQFHWGAIHCVRSGNPSWEGSGQQCCYDRNGFLMLSFDQQWGSRPHRSHNLGLMPWTEANKVPTNSHWFHDMIPFYQCCLWQSEQAVGCETFRFERRPSQDCVAYQSPGVAGVFGDPHLITFDDVHYTFNGKGEFVLVRVDDPILRMEVQGRFEQVVPNRHGAVNATHLTSIVASANSSIPIEVRIRPKHAQWRYRLDVFANGRRVFFDRPALKVQNFRGVTVYTPTYILNQSEVIIMFPSGAGIEVVENEGFMTSRVYLPWTYINRTRGLFGNWSWDMNDDFMRPDGTIVPINLANFQSAHDNFAAFWQLTDRHQDNIGRALFLREFGRTAAHYADSDFRPNFIREPRDFLPADRIVDINRATELCDNSYQCRFDYGMTLNRDLAEFTKNYYSSIVNIRETNDKRVLSCGILETPRFGRKTTFMFTPGTRVTFECDQNFFLNGDRSRTCETNGRWNLPEYGFTECLREQEWSQRMLLKTGGIILALIVPILLLLMLFYFWCVLKPRKRGEPSWNIQKLEPMKRSLSKLNIKSTSMGNLTDTLKSTNKSDNSDIKDPILDSPIIDEIPNEKQQAAFTRSAPPLETDRDSSGFGNSEKSDKSDLSSLPKKRRAYDKSYRTKEPLPPDMEFPEKLWDLSEEDITSYDSDSGSNKDTLSKPTKDFEYKKPKQLGRRGMSPQPEPTYGPVMKDSSGYASEEPYNIKPQDYGSPRSSYYSPTYSEIYSPPISPTSDSGRAGFYPPNEMPSTPQTAPHDSLKTFTLPLQRGKSLETLIDPPADPNQQGILDPNKEIETHSSRTTMV